MIVNRPTRAARICLQTWPVGSGVIPWAILHPQDFDSGETVDAILSNKDQEGREPGRTGPVGIPQAFQEACYKWGRRGRRRAQVVNRRHFLTTGRPYGGKVRECLRLVVPINVICDVEAMTAEANFNQHQHVEDRSNEI